MQYLYGTGKHNLTAKLLTAGQISLAIGALFGALALIVIALPLHALSWTLTLTAASIAALAMLFAVILLLFAPEAKHTLR